MTSQELYEKYQADLAELQKNCPHHTTFPWEDEYWEPAHSTGSKIRRCETCGIVVERKPGYPDLGQITFDSV